MDTVLPKCSGNKPAPYANRINAAPIQSLPMPTHGRSIASTVTQHHYDVNSTYASAPSALPYCKLHAGFTPVRSQGGAIMVGQ